MPIEPRLDAETAAQNMGELEPKYSAQQARVESERCLYCFDAPCIYSCPTGIDIPAFIRKIATGDLAGSARTILTANPLGASCARVCPTEVLCEGACVLMDRDQRPIKIGRLQRYATDHAYDNGMQLLAPAAEKSGKRVALIGGGPASLACAAELAQLGHDAVVFEKQDQAGGLNTYGIAYYKLRPETSLQEVEMIQSLGVEIRTGCEVGSDVQIAELEAEFDAIFIGVGLGHTYRLGIPGEDLPEVIEALTFIRDIHTDPLHQVKVGRHVAVIGCGNTAIDAVTQAKRLGAETATIIYRRGSEDMPAYAYEHELAKTDGAHFRFRAVPVEILGSSGHVTAMRLARTRVDHDGRVSVLENEEEILPVDMVIKSLGQEKMREMVGRMFPDLKLNHDGTIHRDFETGRTSLPMIYAGGDGANGGSEVVDAVAEGKRAARGIHLDFTGDAIEGPIQTTRLGAPGRPVGAGFNHPHRVTPVRKTNNETTE